MIFIMKGAAIFILPCIAAVLNSCVTSPATPVERPMVYAVKAPAAGNYPQGLYKFPYRQNTASAELFTQTLEWSPPVQKTFAADTQYTAKLTLTPASPRYTFDGVMLEDVQGLPEHNVAEISTSLSGSSMVINITFEKTARQNAEPELLFYDDFDGTALDGSKWAICPGAQHVDFRYGFGRRRQPSPGL